MNNPARKFLPMPDTNTQAVAISSKKRRQPSSGFQLEPKQLQQHQQRQQQHKQQHKQQPPADTFQEDHAEFLECERKRSKGSAGLSCRKNGKSNKNNNNSNNNTNNNNNKNKNNNNNNSNNNNNNKKNSETKINNTYKPPGDRDKLETFEDDHKEMLVHEEKWQEKMHKKIREKFPDHQVTAAGPSAFEERIGQDMKFHVFSFLDYQSLLRCERVCKSWRAAASHPTLWKRLCMQNLDYSVVQLWCGRKRVMWRRLFVLEMWKDLGVTHEPAKFTRLTKPQRLLLWSDMSTTDKETLWDNMNQYQQQALWEELDDSEKADMCLHSFMDLDAVFRATEKNSLTNFLAWMTMDEKIEFMYRYEHAISDIIDALGGGKNRELVEKVASTDSHLLRLDGELRFWGTLSFRDRVYLLNTMTDEETRAEFWEDLEEDERMDLWPSLDAAVRETLTNPFPEPITATPWEVAEKYPKLV